jgi:RNA polymerase primary sigma factor
VAGTISLDQPIFEEGELTLSDTIPQTAHLSPEEQAMMQSVRRSIQSSLKKLNPNEQRVIHLRFGLNGDVPMTLEQVGSVLRLSRERIRQIEREALNKMRDTYSGQTVENYLN